MPQTISYRTQNVNVKKVNIQSSSPQEAPQDDFKNVHDAETQKSDLQLRLIFTQICTIVY